MGKETLTRLLANFLGFISQISVEPCYLGYAISWGLSGIIVNEMYISKVQKNMSIFSWFHLSISNLLENNQYIVRNLF